jgi:hypothetical protein
VKDEIGRPGPDGGRPEEQGGDGMRCRSV